MAAILEMQHICKQFPGVLANEDVCLSVEQGEVHAILGENGAGKSTLMNLLCGLYRPTSGLIFIHGKQEKFASAKDAMKIGIGMVHQHFMLIPNMTVVQNCLIGEKITSGTLNFKAAAERISAIAAEYNMKIDPYAMVESLSVGEQQRVEIIKALYKGAEILILDEPTAVLTPQETDELFKMIRVLIQGGRTVLFISHKLNEIKAICDRVTVMRRGCVVGTYRVADCSVNELATLMVGRSIQLVMQHEKARPGDVVLDVQNLMLKRPDSDSNVLNDLSFQVREGEILGIAGVDGNGQHEMVECLVGLMRATSGNVLYLGENITNWNTRRIMSASVSHIPQDRQTSGLVMPMSIMENLILQDYYKKGFGRNLFIDWKTCGEYADRMIREFRIKTPSRYELAQNLSGGNQQGVIVARELSHKPQLLIAMHPTRGLDVGRIEYIHKLLIAQRNNGLAILLVSTELDEVMELSDRVLTMFEGSFMGEIDPRTTSSEEMGLMMGGLTLNEIRRKAV